MLQTDIKHVHHTRICTVAIIIIMETFHGFDQHRLKPVWYMIQTAVNSPKKNPKKIMKHHNKQQSSKMREDNNYMKKYKRGCT